MSSTTATYRDAAQNLTRTTLPVPCPDPVCADLSGSSEPAALETRADARGRPLRVDTPDGFSVYSYFAVANRPYPAALGGPGPFDGVLEKNGKGDLLQRVMDGDRLVFVDECPVGVDPAATDLAQVSCGSPTDGPPDTTLYTWEPTGELGRVYDAVAVSEGDYWDPNHHLRYDYDTLGRPLRIHDPDLGGNGFTATEYHPNGSAFRTTNASGQTRSFSYDDLGRLLSIATPAGEDAYSVRYRSTEIQREKDWSNAYERTYSYDPWGRLQQNALTVAETNTGPFLIDYEYDLVGRPQQITYPESTRVRYEYEGAYLERVCDLGASASVCSGSGVVHYVSDAGYDSRGRRETTVMAAGTRTFVYDGSLPRLASDSFTASADPFSFQLAYPSHDGLGNIKSVVGSSSAGDIDLNEAYQYDVRNRLKQWTKEGTDYHYDYDPLGNLVLNANEVQVYLDATRPHAITQRQTPGVSYSHDPNGNVDSIVRPNGARYYTFDSANRLVCIDETAAGGCGVTRIHYDVDGRKVFDDRPAGLDYTAYLDNHTRVEGAPLPTRTLIDIVAFGERIAYKQSSEAIRVAAAPGGVGSLPWGGIAVVLGLSGLLGWAQRRDGLVLVVARPRTAGASIGLSILLFVGPPIPQAQAGGGGGSVVYWEIADRLGTGLVMVDEMGARIVHRTFTPFGQEHAVVGNAPYLPVHFAGHLEEEHAGLFYMQARWYDAGSGTFLSVDPLVPDAGDPQSYNAYAYARNNPVRYNDPTGLTSLELPPGIDFEVVIVGPYLPGGGDMTRPISLIDLVADNFISGQAHVVWANIGHIGSFGPAAAPGASQSQNPFGAESEPDAHGLWESTPALREDISTALDNIGESFPTEEWGNPADLRFTHIQNEERALLTARGGEPVGPLNLLTTESIRTSGLHPRNIRFDRIHLTYDPGARGGLVPRIHADRFSPYPGLGNLLLHGLEVSLPGL